MKSGKYKDDTFRGAKGDQYDIETWQKCGVCPECLAEKANNWVVRNYYESKAHKDKCFITLTYANSPGTLVKKDVQDFLKRLRKRVKQTNNIEFRFYNTGEYGTRKARPHYHIALYGWKEQPKKLTYMGLNQKLNILFESETIQEAWGLGRTTYQKYVDEEIPYISLYTSLNEVGRKEKYIHVDQIKKYKERLKNDDRYGNLSPIIRKSLINNLMEEIRQCEQVGNWYKCTREYHTFSQGIGFDYWFKNIYTPATQNGQEYTWQECIRDGIYQTPKSWIEKVANFGEIGAIREIQRRQKYEIDRMETAEERRNKKINEQGRKNINAILEWNEKRVETIM